MRKDDADETRIVVRICFGGGEGKSLNLKEMFFELMPGIQAVYELGFLPGEEHIVEVGEEHHVLLQAQGIDITQRWFAALQDPNAEPPGSPNEIGLFTEEQMPRLFKAADFLRRYAKKNGCTSNKDEDILFSAAGILPEVFSEGTRFARERGNKN